MTQPTFSIVIPSYNYAHFLKATLDSVFAQGLSDVQVILVDDHSQDNTAEVVHPYLHKIEYSRNEVNLGAGGAWSAGVAKASGRYIIKLDADDELVPHSLRAVETAFELNPNAGAVISSSWILENSTKRMRLKLVSNRDEVLTSEQFRQKLLSGFFFKMPACALRGELVKDCQPPLKDLYQVHDWEFILRATKAHGAVLLREPAAIYRVHDQSITTTARAGDRLCRDIGTWLELASRPGAHLIEESELRRLRGSMGELMLTGFLPQRNIKSIVEYAKNYGNALKIAGGGGLSQVLRMHWSLCCKLLNILFTSERDRPVVRKV